MRMAPLAILFLLSLALAMGLFNRPSDQISSQLVGKKVGAFEIPMIGSNDKLSPKYWRGKVVLVNAFASWCQPCTIEHETLMKLTAAQKVEMIGIAWKDKPENVVKWLQAKGNPYHVIGMDEYGKTTLPLALSGVPETYIIDKQGMIAYHYPSVLTQEEVDKVIIPMIEYLNKPNAP